MEIAYDIEDIISKFRRIKRLVMSDRFREAYRSASPEEKEKAKLLATSGQQLDLEHWIHKQNRSLGLYLLSLRELRLKAKELGIPRYCHLDKATLSSEILRYGKEA